MEKNGLEEFEYAVVKNASAFFTNSISIFARDKEEADEKARNLNSEEIEELVNNEWELSDEIIESGEIEIYDDEGESIK